MVRRYIARWEKSMEKRIYMKGISHEIEETRDIRHLEEIRDNPDLLETFRSLGVASYSSSKQSLPELAAACAARSLWKGKVAPESIGLLVLASTRFGDITPKDVQWLIAKLGIKNAYPVGVTLSECANFIIALSVAVDALQQERYKNALVITVDKIQSGSSRIVPPDVSVASDSAASVILSAEEGPYEVLGTQQHMIPLQYETSAQEDFGRYLKTSASGLAEIANMTLAASGNKPEDLSWLVTNNYNTSVAALFAAQFRVDPSRVYMANISRYGHCFGADSLINLSHCTSENRPSADDLLCLLASGPNMWATALLRKV